jgi:hypothetical protein
MNHVHGMDEVAAVLRWLRSPSVLRAPEHRMREGASTARTRGVAFLGYTRNVRIEGSVAPLPLPTR